jgi:hypothetical protein
MERTLALLALGLLVGCAPSPPPDLRPWAAEVRARCSSEPTHLAAERCANPTIVARYISEGHADRDIAQAYAAKREDIAARWDRGEITADEAAADFADLNREANVLQEQRTSARNAAAADTLANAPNFSRAPYQPLHVDMPSPAPTAFVSAPAASHMPPGGDMPAQGTPMPAQTILGCMQQNNCAGVGQ